jgi:DNA primase
MRPLVLEGEFNCMVLHQAGLVAISLGSQTGAQSHATLERLLTILPQYPEIAVWFDDPHQGQRLADRLIEAEPFRKEKTHLLASHSLDANEMLRQSELHAYLATHGITANTES